MNKLAQLSIAPIVGQKKVTGSPRMKAGRAQNPVLNIITTGAMIRNGKVFGNLMVETQTTNNKLVQRQKNIVMEATVCLAAPSTSALTQAEF